MSDWTLNAQDYAERLNAIDALRPPCPTCGGTKGKRVEEHHGFRWEPCPENGGNCDGKVSIEQMAVTWRAVWECPIRVSTIADEIEIAKCKGHNTLRDHLQGVQP